MALQLLREMTVHTLAEETVVYPVVAEQVGTACVPHAPHINQLNFYILILLSMRRSTPFRDLGQFH